MDHRVYLAVQVYVRGDRWIATWAIKQAGRPYPRTLQSGPHVPLDVGTEDATLESALRAAATTLEAAADRLKSTSPSGGAGSPSPLGGP